MCVRGGLNTTVVVFIVNIERETKMFLPLICTSIGLMMTESSQVVPLILLAIINVHYSGLFDVMILLKITEVWVWRLWMITFMKRFKNRGSRTLPWGTSLFHAESVWYSVTDHRYSDIACRRRSRKRPIVFWWISSSVENVLNERKCTVFRRKCLPDRGLEINCINADEIFNNGYVSCIPRGILPWSDWCYNCLISQRIFPAVSLLVSSLPRWNQSWRRRGLTRAIYQSV